MKQHDDAVELIAKLEGFRSSSYRDCGGVLTIGFGTIRYPNGTPVKNGDKCTLEEAKGWLKDHLKKYVFPRLDSLNLPDPVYVAMSSLGYNIGLALSGKSITEAIKQRNWGTFNENEMVGTGLAGAFLKYVKVRIDGNLVFSKGLENRRVIEIKYFLSGLNGGGKSLTV